MLAYGLFQGAGYLKRADSERLHDIFLKYATVERNGEKYITSEDFVRKFLGLFDEGMFAMLAILTEKKNSYMERYSIVIITFPFCHLSFEDITKI